MIAVSATNLYPLYVDLGPLARALQKITPVDRVGQSILIYRMDEDVRLDFQRSCSREVAGKAPFSGRRSFTGSFEHNGGVCEEPTSEM
jgi:hypothetical protein